jgi:tetratricopeptide (TPR) repeat protein
MLMPEEIAAEIGRSLDFLETDLRDVPERQRSIRAVFDHSFNLLAERERKVFQASSVFRGGFTRKTAQCVAGASLRDLKGLVDRSLLQRAATGRYEMHELLRQYAGEKLDLEPAVSEAAHDQHCAYYIAALEQWGVDLKGARQLATFTEMDVEIENAREAWNWAVQRRQVARLDRAIFGLCQYYTLRGRFQECESACAAAAQRLEGIVSGDVSVLRKAQGLRVWARVLSWQSRAVFRLGSYEAGRQLVQQGLALLDDPALAGQDTRAERAFILKAMLMIGWYTEGEKARQLREEILALCQEMGDRQGVAGMLRSLGRQAFWLGDLDEAEQRAEETMALWQELSDQYYIGRTYAALGGVARERGELDRAEHLYRKAIEILQEIRNPGGIRWAQQWLGLTLMLAGKLDQARRLLEETLATFGYLGDIAEAGLRGELAAVEMHAGDYGRARVQGETSLALSKNASYAWGIAASLRELSGVVLAEAESGLSARTAPQVQNTGAAREAYAEAQQLAQESAAVCREIGARLWLGDVLAILGVAAHGSGDVDHAQQHLCEALRVAGDIGAFRPLMLALPATALLLADLGQVERAVEIYALVSRYPFVANSRWFEDVAGKQIAAVAATLPPEVVAAAQERGWTRELHATVAELLVELEE